MVTCVTWDVFPWFNQGTEAQSSISGPALEEPTLARGAVTAAHCSPVAHSPETRIPLSGECNDLAPPAQTMGAASLASRWEPSNLPESVLNTSSQARAPSTRHLYALKFSVFSTWCTTHCADPVLYISLIMSFLQEQLEKGRSPFTLNVYVTAIAVSHTPIDGQSVGRTNLVVRFLKGLGGSICPALSLSRHGICPHCWGPSFWAATVCWPSSPDAKDRSAASSNIGKTYGISAGAISLEFGPNDSKIVLKPRHGYIPKFLSTPFRVQVITLSALPPSEQDQGLNLLCPVKALRIHIERCAPFRQLETAICMLWQPHQRVSGHKAETIQMAGPRQPHLPGFIIWNFRPGSFLHNGLTLVIWQTSMALPSSSTLLVLNRTPRLYRFIWDDYARPGQPLWVWPYYLLQGFPVQYLVPLGPTWCLRQVQVLVVPLA